MKVFKYNFNWEDYQMYCKVFDKKPSHYQSLKDFRHFIDVMNLSK